MWRFGIILAAMALAASAARADTSPPPEKFFSLSAPRHLPDGKVTVPLRGSAHFFPLAQKGKFFPLPRRAGSRIAGGVLPHPSPQAAPTAVAPAGVTPKAPPVEAIAANAAPPDSHTGMTRDEAHQILSLFSSTR